MCRVQCCCSLSVLGACCCDPLWESVQKGRLNSPACRPPGRKGGSLRGGLSHICVAGTTQQPGVFQKVNTLHPHNSKGEQFVVISTSQP